MGLKEAVAALLGVSTYEKPPPGAASLDDLSVERLRKMQGGQLSPLPQTKTRWYLADLESATYAADYGDLGPAARLCRGLRRDGVIAGLLSTSSGGLVRLPKHFTGRKDIIEALEGKGGVRSVFDEMFPASELELFASDGELLGVSVGELRPVQGRAFPVFVRLDPEFLRYRWNENRWYYQTIAGLIAITPGDGRWVLHTRGGRVAPWQHGLWYALARAWIHKEHALLHKANWEAKLANPARAAFSPLGTTDAARSGFMQSLIAWGVNTVFELPAGWDVKIIESNGRGWESFKDTIEWAEREFIIALAGQTTTTTGGEGFSNGDVGKSVRADLIEARADALAYTINTQGIPCYVESEFGEEALEESGCVAWDTTPPRDLAAEAQAMLTMAQGVAQMDAALKPYGKQLDIEHITTRYALKIVNAPKEAVAKSSDKPKFTLAPTDVASIIKVNEAREDLGLDGMEDGELTLVDFRAKHAAAIAAVSNAEGSDDTEQAAK